MNNLKENLENIRSRVDLACRTAGRSGEEVAILAVSKRHSAERIEALAERLRERGTAFVIEPYVRFQGQVGEQATMFLLDPCGNALEFKAFKDLGSLFAK